jgi:Tol biopolymer transport system component
MKALPVFLFAMTLIALSSCMQAPEEQTTEENVINKPSLNLTDDRMNPEVLWSFGRVGGVELSPDYSQIVYSVKYYDKAENKGNNELYSYSITDGKVNQLTHSNISEFNAIWRPDGEKVGFISSENGHYQIWEMKADGSQKTRIEGIEGNVFGFKYSPDQKKILFVQEVKVGEDIHDLHPDLPETSGKLVSDLMYRHWDHWVETYTHLFVGDYENGKVSNIIDLLEGKPWETPMKPFGGMEQINWNAHSDQIAYTCKKMSGKDYSLSTNSDIYIYNLKTKETTNISAV